MQFTIEMHWQPGDPQSGDTTLNLPKVDGWDGLDQARAISAETADVNMALVDPIPADRVVEQGTAFALSETQARATQSFQRDDARKLNTSEKRLKKWFLLVGVVEKTGDIISRVGWRYEFDGALFISQWVAAGEPQDWP